MKQSAQYLLETKIYPNYNEFKESAKKFLRESDPEFFSSLDSRWNPYYEKKIRTEVSKIYKLIYSKSFQLIFKKSVVIKKASKISKYFMCPSEKFYF